MIKTKDAVSEAKGLKTAFGIAFELENLAFRGRDVMYKTCEDMLAQKKIDFSRILFSRYFLDYSLEEGLSRLLAAEGRKMSAEKLADEIGKQYAAALEQASCLPDKNVVSALAELNKEKIAFGALTLLPETSAAVLMDKLGLGESAVLPATRNKAGSLPARDHWIGLMKKMEVNAQSCLAIGTSAVSHCSALAAKMRCVVVTDEFTDFQDFAGADMVIQSAEDISAKKLLNLLRVSTTSFRR